MPRLEGPSGRWRWAHPNFCSQGVLSLIGEPDTHPMARHPGKCCDGRSTGTKRPPAHCKGTPGPEGTPGLTLERGEAVCLLGLRGGWPWLRVKRGSRKEAEQWAGPGNGGPAGERSGFYPKALGSHRRLFSKRGELSTYALKSSITPAAVAKMGSRRGQGGRWQMGWRVPQHHRGSPVPSWEPAYRANPLPATLSTGKLQK